MLPIEIGCEKIWKMHRDLEAKSAPPSRVSSFRRLPQRANSDKSTDDDENQFSLSYLRVRKK
jgi:hypothetical protein